LLAANQPAELKVSKPCSLAKGNRAVKAKRPMPMAKASTDNPAIAIMAGDGARSGIKGKHWLFMAAPSELR